MSIVWFLIGIVVGIYFGSRSVVTAWSENAFYPTRISYKCDFYKVVKCNDEDSWRMLKIHIPKDEKEPVIQDKDTNV